MTPEELNKFIATDSVTVEGITDEYVWYHAKLLSAKMSQWDNDFQKLVKVMESRHKFPHLIFRVSRISPTYYF